MNRILTRIIHCSFYLSFLTAISTADETSAIPPVPKRSITVAIIDDLTSGGASPGAVAAAQLYPLLELAGKSPLTIRYHLVQETVQTPVVCDLKGWSLKPPLPPSPSLPTSIYRKEATRFLKAVAAFKWERKEWEKSVGDVFSKFITDSTQSQVTIEIRWMAELDHRGRDFRRSAVADLVLAVGQSIKGAATSYVIIASDCKDQPPLGQGRAMPFSENEFNPDIHLIFIRPERNSIDRSLFSNLKNQVETVDSLADAIQTVVEGVTANSRGLKK